jgi:hypothetical protein
MNGYIVGWSLHARQGRRKSVHLKTEAGGGGQEERAKTCRFSFQGKASVMLLPRNRNCHIRIRQHTSACVSMRQYTAAYVSVHQVAADGRVTEIAMLIRNQKQKVLIEQGRREYADIC